MQTVSTLRLYHSLAVFGVLSWVVCQSQDPSCQQRQVIHTFVHVRRQRRSCTIRQISTGSCQSAQDSPLKRYACSISERPFSVAWCQGLSEPFCSRRCLASNAAWSEALWGMQIDEDTDRDRYMSPLEAKQYGLIDQVIGGDDAGFKARSFCPLLRILIL